MKEQLKKRLVDGAYDNGQDGQDVEVEAEVEQLLLDLALAEYQSVPAYVERFRDERFRQLVEQLRQEAQGGD